MKLVVEGGFTAAVVAGTERSLLKSHYPNGAGGARASTGGRSCHDACHSLCDRHISQLSDLAA